MKRFLVGVSILSASVFGLACEPEPDTPGEAVEEAGEEIGDALDDAGDAIEDTAEDITE